MLLCMIVNIETIAWRWCINELRAISFLLSVYSGQSNPDRDGNGPAEVSHAIQGGHSDMHLGHLGFEETGRQVITQHLLEAIEAIFGETALGSDHSKRSKIHHILGCFAKQRAICCA